MRWRCNQEPVTRSPGHRRHGRFAVVVDRYRPLIHFAPPSGWCNDPTGITRTRDGWRVFFQYAEDAPEFRRLNWGTATSADLLNWRFEGIAIEAYDGVSIYSGCVRRVEQDEAAGLQGKVVLDAYHTAHRTDADGRVVTQTQERRRSVDGGRSFDGPAAQPMLTADSIDFRDPFVLASGDGNLAMIVACPVNWQVPEPDARSTLAVYRSQDGSDWTRVGSIGPFDAPAVLWEVPWVVRDLHGGLTQSDVLGLSRVDRSEGGVVCSAHYFAGDFIGTGFELAAGFPSGGIAIDHGPDFYAAVPSVDTSAQRTLMIGWLGNWAYARALTLASWSGGVLSMPREIEWIDTPDGPRLRQQPCREWLERGRPADEDYMALVVDERTEMPATFLFAAPTVPYRLDVEIVFNSADSVAIVLFGGALSFEVRRRDRRFILVRAPDARLPPAWAGTWSAEGNPDARQVAETVVGMSIYVDTCCVEIFADDGAIVFSALCLPNNPTDSLCAVVRGGAARVEVAGFSFKPRS